MTLESDKKIIYTKEKAKNITRGYISGFFDAEGMIRIESCGTPKVSIKQTYKPVLSYINNIFEGSINRYVPKNDHKISFRLNISQEDIVRFLDYIYPNIIEKKEQAKLMLYYIKRIKPSKRDYFRLSETNRQQREWFSKKLETLKHEKHDEQELKNYDKEIKKLQIPKDIREGRQSTIFGIDCIYEELGIDKKDYKTTDDNIDYISCMSEDALFGYMIGFFDGEGYVGIGRGHRDSYHLRLAVTNSNFGILKMYNNIYGGNIRPKSNKYSQEYHKNIWLWEIFNNDVLIFLRKIYPYTKVKKEQIFYAIKFQEFHNAIKIINTLEKKKIAEQYMLKLKELKKDTGENINDYNNKSHVNNIDKCQISIEKAWSM